MNLTDPEILELNQLCAGLVDGTLSKKQKARLSELLAGSEAARRFYVRAMGLSASLYSYAGELQTEKVEVPAGRGNPFQTWWRQWQRLLWGFGALATACVALMVWNNQRAGQVAAPVTAPKTEESVALLSGAKDCQWTGNEAAPQPGSQLHKGQRLELASGFAEVTFDSGAQVVLEGPASLDVKSAWEATLNHGKLKAHVPKQAIGFSISNPNVEVVDLGTEFTMNADTSGKADVLVLKGEVEAQSKAADARQPIVLAAKESRRFESSGVSAADDAAENVAELTKPLALDHFEPLTDVVHWSFDETNGEIFEADASGRPVAADDARLNINSPGTASAAHDAGKWGGALKFDGHTYVKAAFPGLSGVSQHTVSFWVKVPQDARLSTAYSMVAWAVNNEKLGSHPIHIGWNRNPSEGTVGVLRTDYGGGFAMGSTPLRDGQWHHIAVILTPNGDADKTMEVKQYVDGRLEGEGQSSPPGSEVFKLVKEEKEFSLNNIVWLGCRVGINGVRQERFSGEMDELYIADRELEPQEIVSLMNYNKLQVDMVDNEEE